MVVCFSCSSFPAAGLAKFKYLISLMVPFQVVKYIHAPFSNHSSRLRIELRAEYWAISNQVRNFESPGTGLLHAD